MEEENFEKTIYQSRSFMPGLLDRLEAAHLQMEKFWELTPTHALTPHQSAAVAGVAVHLGVIRGEIVALARQLGFTESRIKVIEDDIECANRRGRKFGEQIKKDGGYDPFKHLD